MLKPRVLVFSGYGLNCEEETAYAFNLAGGQAEIIHVNDLIDGKKKLSSYQILAFPGGFSYGDDTGSGNAYANKVKNYLWKEIEKFLAKDHLIIGVCNGFQILVNLGLIPAIGKQYGKRQAALTHNDTARYIDRWVDLEVRNNNHWLRGIKTISLPIAHGEGKFFASDKILKKLKEKKMVVLKYTRGKICKYQNLKANPNGSLQNIAGITNETGKILGLMPHPERAIFFHHLPHWPYLKEKYLRQNKRIPKYGPGLKIFENGVNYFN